jgi:hypothetical protein
MLFAEAVCNPVDEPETPEASDAGQRSVSSVPRFVPM